MYRAIVHVMVGNDGGGGWWAQVMVVTPFRGPKTKRRDRLTVREGKAEIEEGLFIGFFHVAMSL